MPLHFTLVTPERMVFEEKVAAVTLPTAEGEITVLPKHMPLVALLKAGVAVLLKPDGTKEDVAVSGGFIHVSADDRVTVLADTAERGLELTLEVIVEAKQRAAELMQQKRFADDTAYAQAAAALERELARYKAAVRHRARKGLPTIEQANLPAEENPL